LFSRAARFESAAPKTVAAFTRHLPFRARIVHVRWSGEAVWIPLGERDFGVAYENHTRYPAPGQIILYPGGISETEILIAYGGVAFSSKLGQLAGNHFATIVSVGGDTDHDAVREGLREMGRRVLWDGAQDIAIAEL
jgi:hypothetical protein